MINNRQNGRRRGRGNNNGGGGGNQRQGGGQGRGDSGNRIDSRARGNAAQLLEKYRNMAADAQRQGDRVNTEYYLQFADHYFRVLADQRGRFEEQQPQQRRPMNGFDLDGDEEYGDEGEPIRGGEQGGDGAERQERQERQPQQQGREDRGQRRWEQRGERGDRAERPARDDRPEQPIAGQHRSDPPMPGEDLDARAEQVLEADAPLPRRRGRPRRESAGDDAGGNGGGGGGGVDADRLPPSLGVSAMPANDREGDEAPKPRRRRTPRVAGEGAPAAE